VQIIAAYIFIDSRISTVEGKCPKIIYTTNTGHLDVDVCGL